MGVVPVPPPRKEEEEVQGCCKETTLPSNADKMREDRDRNIHWYFGVGNQPRQEMSASPWREEVRERRYSERA